MQIFKFFNALVIVIVFLLFMGWVASDFDNPEFEKVEIKNGK